MRMAFGLVSLLVTLGVIVVVMKYAWLPHTQAVRTQGRNADVQVSQIAGVDENGTHIEDTYALSSKFRPDNRLQDLLVANIQPGSPLQAHFGLQKNDIILAAVDSHGVRTDFAGSSDDESCKLAVREAYVGSGQLYVRRGNQTLLLRDGKPAVVQADGVTPPVAHTPAATGQPTPPAAQRQDNPVDDTGDAMQQINRRIHPVGMN